MTTLRPFVCDDLFRFNNVNLDPLTETNEWPFCIGLCRHEAKLSACIPIQNEHKYCKLLLKRSIWYGIPFYLQYLSHWPEYFQVAESPSGEIMGYIMGKAEGKAEREQWHGHVTAVTVAPQFRRVGLAAKLMVGLEEISERKQAFFVDLFVRVSNKVAVDMYERLGYVIYRRVLEYYSGDPDEDAFDMRKALSRDKDKKSIIPLKDPVRPEDVE